MDKPIPRVTALDPDAFVSSFVAQNQPVIVVDAMRSWRALAAWTPEGLVSHHGDCEVQVYNSLFDLVDVIPLKTYIRDNFGKPPSHRTTDYVRWYAKFKDVDFYWADAFFQSVSEDWRDLDFFPRSDLLVPVCSGGETRSVVTDPFPYKGLFVSARGARTRLHRDPFGSDAILCQVYGSKAVTFYAPDQASKLQDERGCVDPEQPDAARFPNFADTVSDYEDVLQPGEVLYVPGGWFHDVRSISDSVSVTWNFVHSVRRQAFRDALAGSSAGGEQEVIQYFT